METVLASLVAVLGTLVGSFSTYLFQRRTARHGEEAARAELRRQERLTACSEFAAAATELKRGLITAWFRRRDGARDEDAHRAAQADSDRLGAAAETARFRLLLAADDPELHRLADQALAVTGRIHRAADRAEVIAVERDFEAALGTFVTAAAARLR
ncbi:hypothetical protein ACGFX4_12730 [Kitasatospora sp. NPDC048365]|uniref:hypothetical protein n=1 Tax=Kitasatospora sp. NPDC048365 TaxID=3364050 RepID=UPI003723B4B1